MATSFRAHYKALMTKNYTVWKRNKCGSCCEVHIYIHTYKQTNTVSSMVFGVFSCNNLNIFKNTRSSFLFCLLCFLLSSVNRFPKRYERLIYYSFFLLAYREKKIFIYLFAGNIDRTNLKNRSWTSESKSTQSLRQLLRILIPCKWSTVGHEHSETHLASVTEPSLWCRRTMWLPVCAQSWKVTRATRGRNSPSKSLIRSMRSTRIQLETTTTKTFALRLKPPKTCLISVFKSCLIQHQEVIDTQPPPQFYFHSFTPSSSLAHISQLNEFPPTPQINLLLSFACID